MQSLTDKTHRELQLHPVNTHIHVLAPAHRSHLEGTCRNLNKWEVEPQAEQPNTCPEVLILLSTKWEYFLLKTNMEKIIKFICSLKTKQKLPEKCWPCSDKGSAFPSWTQLGKLRTCIVSWTPFVLLSFALWEVPKGSGQTKPAGHLNATPVQGRGPNTGQPQSGKLWEQFFLTPECQRKVQTLYQKDSKEKPLGFPPTSH